MRLKLRKHRSTEAKSLKNYKPKVVQSKKVYSRKRACIKYAGALANLPEPTSKQLEDIPEVTDWSGATRGKFFRG